MTNISLNVNIKALNVQERSATFVKDMKLLMSSIVHCTFQRKASHIFIKKTSRNFKQKHRTFLKKNIKQFLSKYIAHFKVKHAFKYRWENILYFSNDCDIINGCDVINGLDVMLYVMLYYKKCDDLMAEMLLILTCK